MKQAIITGASDGIGSEIAQLLAKKDYTITAVARSEDKITRQDAGKRQFDKLCRHIDNNSTCERFETGLKGETHNNYPK